ncbi:multiple inositol polyphosphate phosphatase 1b [Megalops cyprinoides]|uniref:multiple inositol polyphosphate phosphatase 1b n=1 Tax=Megalops cyprinoides TaxID=118141 RepID=UPI001864E079|nr:multiple inositol polyphosphate phosphatase 1b [Megalops cyprinoides]
MRRLVSNRGFVLTAFSFALVRVSYCSAENIQVVYPKIPAIAEYFGTKGRYEEVNPHLIDDVLAVNKTLLKPPSVGCSPIHLTAIIRHGTRYPTTKNVKKIRRLYDLVTNEAMNNKKWLHEIKTQWRMWYTEDMDGQIVEKGRDDHRHLAVRLATSFPSLISEENLQRNRIKFITSSKHRCVDSVIAFKEGLLNLWGCKDVEFTHEVNDMLMRFFDKCRRFIEDVENNKTALKEVDLFETTAEMKRVQIKMADRLQLPYSQVTPDLVEAAFYLCSYEFAIKNVSSPWCNLFDEMDAKVLEYANDLKQYWKRGHGHDINRKSSCTLFHDVFSRLDRAANEIRFGHVTEAVAVQVGHAETILPLLSLMGFFKDETPLTSENYAEQQNRSFRTSRIVPYAANLVFVLYDCKEGLRLQFRLNEKPLTFPNISHPVPLYETVRERYKDLLEGCNFDEECEVPRSSCSKCSEL